MGTVIARRQAAVLTLEISNPGKANALDLEMLGQIDRFVSEVEADETVRLVVLRGSAGGTFSAGADIREWAQMTPEAFGRDWIGHGNKIFRRFEQLRCPSVAAIEGLCFGGGFELALCADLRVGTPAARFRFPEVTIGAIPGWEGGPRLARLVGRGRSLELVLSGRELDAETAARWGVVNALHSAEDFESRLSDLAQILTTVSPSAAALAKASIVGAEDPLTFFPSAGRNVRATQDADIGIQAFFGKKKAIF